jgi:hypothetical protein
MGDAERTKDRSRTCTKLGPGRLGTCMETHNIPLHLQQIYYTQWQNEVEEQFSGKEA